jgi:hypothetical protein
MREIDPHKAIDYIIEHAHLFAAAKANRIQLEEGRKSMKAVLMKQSGVDSIGAQEREAYADPEYREYLKGLAASVEEEEKLRWMLEAAKLRIEVYRTESANQRMEGRAVQ